MSQSDLFDPSLPDREQVSLSFVDVGYEIQQWTQYEYAANVEIPADGWSFTIAGESLPDGAKAWIVPGARVQLKVNDTIQGDGYVDSVEVTNSARSGTEFHISGRDRLAQAVDACADPTYTFKEGLTLLDVLVELLGPFGWSSEDQFIVDNDANREAKAGIRGIPRTKGGKKKGPQPLKRFVMHQLRPYPREGVFAFATRVASRHGLMIWQTAQTNQIVVGNPSFDVDPFYKLRRNDRGTTNVLSGSVKYDIKNQATAIVADGASGGGEFGRSRIKSIMANTLVYTKDQAFLEPWKRYPDAHRVLGYKFATPVQVPRARTVYLHDEESTTQAQLDNYVRREMAHLQRESLAVRYEVEGHGQITEAGFVPWTVDTTVEVEDEVAGLNERLYVLGRTFHKSRSSGTTTSLDLIRLHTIELGEPSNTVPAPKVSTDAEIVQQRNDLELD